MRRWLVGLLVVGVLLLTVLAAGTSGAQDDRTRPMEKVNTEMAETAEAQEDRSRTRPLSGDVEERVDELEDRVRDLERTVEALAER